ncbi:MAG TPA: hypothetical protein VFB58_18680 [Chloroflexota bacterium]|nr:hypothetical protein [Chloroflexota bacterium]
MLRLMILLFVALFLISTVGALIGAIIALIVIVTVLAVLATVVGVPFYMLGRHWLGHRSLMTHTNPLEHLQTLYVEGKIDLFEYERRLATLLAVEH